MRLARLASMLLLSSTAFLVACRQVEPAPPGTVLAVVEGANLAEQDVELCTGHHSAPPARAHLNERGESGTFELRVLDARGWEIEVPAVDVQGGRAALHLRCSIRLGWFDGADLSDILSLDSLPDD